MSEVMSVMKVVNWNNFFVRTVKSLFLHLNPTLTYRESTIWVKKLFYLLNISFSQIVNFALPYILLKLHFYFETLLQLNLNNFLFDFLYFFTIEKQKETKTKLYIHWKVYKVYVSNLLVFFWILGTNLVDNFFFVYKLVQK